MPCPFSQFHGQHKYGATHFLDKKRERFTRSCRYCPDIQTGRYVVLPSGATDIIWDHVSEPGLENVSRNDDNPKPDTFNEPVASDIDPNTGTQRVVDK